MAKVVNKVVAAKAVMLEISREQAKLVDREAVDPVAQIRTRAVPVHKAAHSKEIVRRLQLLRM
ncbi:MAG TPA: hypothetical protein VFT06_11720 [Flavisolibacter sp.]|nr:hypothetical protein [Flavisolibacter sp.]